MNNPFSLSGKTILVTGASSGIGKSVAIESSKMGASVLITGRNKERLESSYALLKGEGHKMVIADFQRSEDLNLLVSKMPGLDGIVHSAGITDPLPFRFVTSEKLQTIFQINFNAPALLTQQILKRGLLNTGASVVFISSVSGVYCSSFGASIYSATKGAVNGLIKGMALDLASKLIRVNSVCPGMIETDIYADGRISEDQIDADKMKYPLKRHGKPEEVAYAVIYLLSDASKWVTGSNLLIDGGFTLL